MDEDIIAQLIEENERLRKQLAEENEITDILDERVKNLEYENEMLITNIESFMKRLNAIPVFCRATHEPYLEEFKESHPNILADSSLPLPLDM
jgi:hypothetical protein